MKWLEWLAAQGPFIPVKAFAFTPAHDRTMAHFGYRYGYNRIIGPGERGENVGYFAPEAIDENFVDGRTGDFHAE